MHFIYVAWHDVMRVLDDAQVKMLQGMVVAFHLCYMA